MNNPKVAIMILNYNGRHLLKICLDSVYKTKYQNYEVFIVDNDSTDGSLDLLRRKYPWVKIISLNENYGFCKAYNMAVRLVDHSHIVFLNNDTEVHLNWLSELVKPMLANGRVGIVGSKLLLFEDRSKINHAGSKITPIGGGLDIGIFMEDKEQFNHEYFSAAACGAAMLVKSEVFRKIGGFDELLYAYSEDLDLGWRSWLYGYKVIYAPKSIVYHMLGASWGSSYRGSTSTEKVFLTHRNMLITSVKNFNFTNMFLAIFFYLPFSLLKAITYLRKGLPRHSLSVLKVYVWFFLNIKTIVQRRRTVQWRRVVKDSTLREIKLLMSWGSALREYLRLVRLRSL